jgi:L-asparaginase II
LLAEVTRSGFVESRHYGSVVGLGADGTVAFSSGDANKPMYPRSCNKPLQLVGMLASGLELTPRQLALAASSHSGEPRHLVVVRSILHRYGLTEADLDNTTDLPYGDAARLKALRGRAKPKAITMNCSGKHAAMLATCIVNGWSTSGYRELTHPLQQALTTTIERLIGQPRAHVGVDGCGAPAHAFPLVALARGFQSLILSGDACTTAVHRAMRQFPHLVGGEGRDVTILMEQLDVVAKDGAEGVFAVALPDGRAIALKIDDGSNRARMAVLLAALENFDINLGDLPQRLDVPTLAHGHPVGHVQAALTQTLL